MKIIIIDIDKKGHWISGQLYHGAAYNAGGSAAAVINAGGAP
jgi:hypothetical protein